ncbi:MAG TPA: hypothetical protein VK961_12300 [Chthoniobacter sp.]|nr:hypothetical protein [Chthoniobacter sp.]
MKSDTLQDSGADLVLFARRHPWLTTIVAVILGGVIVFFWSEWRAEQRWQRYASEARARGVKLILADFAQPEIPDDQNFAALPMMRAAFANSPINRPFEMPSIGGRQRGQFPRGTSAPSLGNAMRGERIDWMNWQQFFQSVGFLTEVSDNPSHDVLRALDRHYATAFREWSEWRTRPRCRFPLNLSGGENISPSHLGLFQMAARIFSLHLRAHLAAGDSAAAYADFQDGFQTYRALRDEPTFISGVSRIICLRMLLNAVGDGLQDRAWSDADLTRIEADLSTIRVWDDWQLALASARGGQNTIMESWLRGPMWKRGKMAARSVSFLRGPNRNLEIAYQFCPRMVFRDNQLRKNRYLDELLARIDTAHQTLDPDGRTPSAPSLITGGHSMLYYTLFIQSSGYYVAVEESYIELQLAMDETRLAGALERFRAKYGAYPTGLAELTPEFLSALPIDLYARAPYRYQRVGQTSFRLYSVGRNRRDDGGTSVPSVAERNQLDAVWPSAP